MIFKLILAFQNIKVIVIEKFLILFFCVSETYILEQNSSSLTLRFIYKSSSCLILDLPCNRILPTYYLAYIITNIF
jgi:hypothetical protein